MKRENNKGVSLIEILIAVVVFTILIIPIVNQLATSIRIGQRADAQQAATDYAKSIAETMKQVDISTMYTAAEVDALSTTLGMDSTLNTSYGFSSVRGDGTPGTSIPANSYLTTMPVAGGTTAWPSVTAMYQAVNRYNALPEHASSQEALVREYTFTGSAKVDYRNYDVLIRMDTTPYAVASLNHTDYYDPNAANLGNLSSLDADLTAVITNVSNSDVTATSSYYSSIISALESSGDPSDAQIAVQIKNGTRAISERPSKRISITIDEINEAGNPNKYQVTCEVVYQNNGIVTRYGVSPEAATLDYTPYQQQFVDIPDVYLMYNQFLYNKEYGDDLITVTNNMSETAKIYVIRTAETDSKVSDVTSLGGSLIPTETAYDRDVQSGTNFLYLTRFMLINDLATHPVEIYTNIPMRADEGLATERPNVVSSTDASGDKSGKMTINVPTSTIPQVVKALEEDERYSEQGRIYNIYIELTNKDTGVVTTFDTSKGDY